MSRLYSEIKEIQFENARFLPEVIKLLNEGHTVTLKLKGFSMRPFLENNRDKALLTKPINIQKGDVVLAEIQPGCYVLHRIIRIKDGIVTLRGDGNINSESCPLSGVKAFALGFYRKDRTRLDKTNGIKWRIYSFIWLNLYPVRRYLLGAYRKIWLKMFKPI